MTDQRKLLDTMRDMTRHLMKGGPQAATAAIQKALHDAGLAPATPASDGHDASAAPPGLRDINPPPAGKASHQPSEDSGAHQTRTSGRARFVSDLLDKVGVAPGGVPGGGMGRKFTPEPIPAGARFTGGAFTNAAGTRHYKLYVPACYDGQPLPLVVMLHGCTQDPDDFAAGTQMNAVAEAQRCFVLYPQQSQSANSSRCWNWFNAADQQRDAGEPSIIAGMTREVMAGHAVDTRQVYIAGLSAGGAMAAIMGTTYPDLYAGVAVHSGLPYGAATDLPSALAAMRSGMAGAANEPRRSGTRAFKGIPVIVFHGDADHTVNMKNGEQVIATTAPVADASGRTREAGRVANGHAYTRTVQSDASGKPVAEHWLIHGFGHAWAGGSANGSYTDARGPDATGEMMRFFYTQAKAA